MQTSDPRIVPSSTLGLGVSARALPHLYMCVHLRRRHQMTPATTDNGSLTVAGLVSDA